MIEIEVQNETHQTQERLRFATVPRIGEGLRLREPDGCWASYDVLDVWYQKAEFGDVWMPYLHVCLTAGESVTPAPAPAGLAPQGGGAQVHPLHPPQARPATPYASLNPMQENTLCRT